MIIKGIFIPLLPTIIIPAIIVGFVINYFGLTIDSLIAIIFLGQFYIIWAQLEVALRQNRLTTLEYEPEFKIDIKEIETTKYAATLRSKHLARNIRVSITSIDEHSITKLCSRILGDIDPDKPHPVYTFEEGDLINKRVYIDIDYLNILGELGSVTFRKVPEFFVFVGVERVKMPGILLNSFETLLSIRKRI